MNSFRMGITLHDTHGHGPHGHSHGAGPHGHAHNGKYSDTDSKLSSTVDELHAAEEHNPVPKTQKKTNINVRAALIHVIGDFIQSLGVFTAALLIFFKVGVFNDWSSKSTCLLARMRMAYACMHLHTLLTCMFLFVSFSLIGK